MMNIARTLNTTLRVVVSMFILKIAVAQDQPPEYDHGLGIGTNRPLNIAHRGSSGMYPENTRESFELAIKQGANMIEVDVSITSDLHLICAHESWLSSKTNIADIFPEDRMNTYFVQGRFITDYFAVDFTLEELRQVKVKQALSIRDPHYDFMFGIPTVEDFIQTVQEANETVGLLVELKDTTWINSLDIIQSANTSIEDIAIDLLHSYGYFTPSDSAVIQSFYPESIQYVADQSDIPVSFLSAAPLTDSVLESLSTYCYAIAVTKTLVVLVNAQNQRVGVTDLVERARNLGLRIHTWTFRNENEYLAWDYGQDPYLEYEDFVMNALVDGLISDFPASVTRYMDVTYV